MLPVPLIPLASEKERERRTKKKKKSEGGRVAMALFECNECGDCLKIPEVLPHYEDCPVNRCPAIDFSCVHCGRVFDVVSATHHTHCSSEAENDGIKRDQGNNAAIQTLPEVRQGVADVSGPIPWDSGKEASHTLKAPVARSSSPEPCAHCEDDKKTSREEHCIGSKGNSSDRPDAETLIKVTAPPGAEILIKITVPQGAEMEGKSSDGFSKSVVENISADNMTRAEENSKRKKKSTNGEGSSLDQSVDLATWTTGMNALATALGLEHHFPFNILGFNGSRLVDKSTSKLLKKRKASVESAVLLGICGFHRNGNLEEQNGMEQPKKKQLVGKSSSEKLKQKPSEAEDASTYLSKIVKWKKLIQKELQVQPDGVMKKKELKHRILPLAQKAAASAGVVGDEKFLELELMRQISLSSKFFLEGKLVCLARKSFLSAC